MEIFSTNSEVKIFKTCTWYYIYNNVQIQIFNLDNTNVLPHLKRVNEAFLKQINKTGKNYLL